MDDFKIDTDVKITPRRKLPGQSQELLVGVACMSQEGHHTSTSFVTTHITHSYQIPAIQPASGCEKHRVPCSVCGKTITCILRSASRQKINKILMLIAGVLVWPFMIVSIVGGNDSYSGTTRLLLCGVGVVGLAVFSISLFYLGCEGRHAYSIKGGSGWLSGHKAHRSNDQVETATQQKEKEEHRRIWDEWESERQKKKESE